MINATFHLQWNVCNHPAYSCLHSFPSLGLVTYSLTVPHICSVPDCLKSLLKLYSFYVCNIWAQDHVFFLRFNHFKQQQKKKFHVFSIILCVFWIQQCYTAWVCKPWCTSLHQCIKWFRIFLYIYIYCSHVRIMFSWCKKFVFNRNICHNLPNCSCNLPFNPLSSVFFRTCSCANFTC